jgi:hypothetical protein
MRSRGSVEAVRLRVRQSIAPVSSEFANDAGPVTWTKAVNRPRATRYMARMIFRASDADKHASSRGPR